MSARQKVFNTLSRWQHRHLTLIRARRRAPQDISNKTDSSSDETSIHNVDVDVEHDIVDAVGNGESSSSNDEFVNQERMEIVTDCGMELDSGDFSDYANATEPRNPQHFCTPV